MGGASGDVLRITGFPSSPGGINLASKYITNACTHSMCEKEQLREGTQGMCEKEQWREGTQGMCEKEQWRESTESMWEKEQWREGTQGMCEKEQWREGTQGMCEKEQWRERLTAAHMDVPVLGSLECKWNSEVQL